MRLYPATIDSPMHIVYIYTISRQVFVLLDVRLVGHRRKSRVNNMISWNSIKILPIYNIYTQTCIYIYIYYIHDILCFKQLRLRLQLLLFRFRYTFCLIFFFFCHLCMYVVHKYINRCYCFKVIPLIFIYWNVYFLSHNLPSTLYIIHA